MTEKPKKHPRSTKKIEKYSMHAGEREAIKILIFALDLNIHESGVEELDAELTRTGEILEELEALYPKDPELMRLREMYTDLKGDVAAERELHLDSSLDKISESLEAQIEESGVRRKTVEELKSGPLKKKVKELMGEGVEIDYVVTSKGRPNAPVIILFTQYHLSSLGSTRPDALGLVEQSQSMVLEGLRGASRTRSAQVRSLMMEGAELGDELNSNGMYQIIAGGQRESAKLQLAAPFAKLEFGDEIRVLGVEDREMHRVVGDRFFSPSETHYRQGSRLRGDVTDVLIAENVDYQMRKLGRKKSGINGLLFGGAHEQEGIPVSSLIAYQGYNVIVVDTVTRIDKEQDRIAQEKYIQYLEGLTMCKGIDAKPFESHIEMWARAVETWKLEDIIDTAGVTMEMYESDIPSTTKNALLQQIIGIQEQYKYVEEQLTDPWILNLLEVSNGEPLEVVHAFGKLGLTFKDREAMTPARIAFMQSAFKSLRRQNLRTAVREMLLIKVSWRSNSHPWITPELELETMSQFVDRYPDVFMREFLGYRHKPWASDLLRSAAYRRLWIASDEDKFGEKVLSKENIEIFKKEEWGAAFFDDVAAKFPTLAINLE